MGFGLLFIGYFVASLMSINVVGSFIAMIGYGIICISASKLSKYNVSFVSLQIGAAVMTLLWLLMSVSNVTEFLANELIISRDIFSPTFDEIMGHVETVAFFAFNAAMLYSVRSIAIETEDGKIALNATRNFIFMCINLLVYVICFVVSAFSQSQYLGILNLSAIIVRFVCVILNLVLIFSCYMRICDENDVDMKRKPSRFAFINKLRERSDEQQRRVADRHAEYMRERAEKRKNKKK